MAEKPLPCPFCGKLPRLLTGKQYSKGWMWMPGIRCPTCHIDREFYSVEEALAWWNTRKVEESRDG